MDVVAAVISAVLGVLLLVLVAYWCYLVWMSFKNLKKVMSVERKLAMMSTETSVREESVESSKKSGKSSTKSRKSTSKPTLSSSKKSSKKRQPAAGSPCGAEKKEIKNCSRKSKEGSSKQEKTMKIVPLEIKGPKTERVEREPERENFCEMIDKMTVWIKDYIECPEKYPVTADSLPGFLYQRLPTHAPVYGVSYDTIIADFQEMVLSGMTHYKHPRFLAQNLLTRSIPDILGEIIAVQIGSPGFIYDASPAVAEMQVAMLNWAGRALGLPERFLFKANSETCEGGASFQESVGDSTLCSLMVARTYATNQQFISSGKIDKRENYLFAEQTKDKIEEHHCIYGKLTVYASSECHPTVEKQCRLAMLRLRKIPVLSEHGYGMTAVQLEKKIKKDIALGRIPACIIITLGTDGLLANDELGKIGRLGMKYNCWVHVMAHNVSCFWIEPQFRPSVDELQYANSIMGHLPYHSPNMPVVWTRNQSVWKDGFRIFAQYLKPTKSYAIDERDWTIHLNRRFRGIKVWLNYRLIGLKRMREHAKMICDLTAYLEEKISHHENLCLFGSRVLNSFCFQYYDKGLNAVQNSKYTRLLGVFINESHRLCLKIAHVGGAVVLSVAISYEGTTKQTLDELYDDLDQLTKYFAQHKDDANLAKFPPDLPPPPSEVAVSITSSSALSCPDKKI